MPSLLTALRERTNNLHVEVEGAMDIMDPAITLTGYEHTLRIFQRFYKELKVALDAHPRARSQNFFSVDRQLARLETDLKNIGAAPASSTVTTPLDMPNVSDEASCMGVFYVVEGSALGGQLISRHLKTTLGLTPENGGAFFHGAGHETGQNWKAFLGRLSEFENKTDAHENVLLAAESTFRCLLQLMQSSSQPTHVGSTS